MALQRLNSPNKLKGCNRLSPHSHHTLIVRKTFAALKQRTAGLVKVQEEEWKRVTVPLVSSLRYSGNWGGRGKLEVSQQRPSRAALPPSLHMRGSWDMYLQYPSLCHTHTTLPEASFTRHMMPGPCGFCASSSGCTGLFCICMYGRIGTDLKKTWEIYTTELCSKYQRSFHFTGKFNLTNGA